VELAAPSFDEAMTQGGSLPRYFPRTAAYMMGDSIVWFSGGRIDPVAKNWRRIGITPPTNRRDVIIFVQGQTLRHPAVAAAKLMLHSPAPLPKPGYTATNQALDEIHPRECGSGRARTVDAHVPIHRREQERSSPRFL